jgi:hypothetical protein
MKARVDKTLGREKPEEEDTPDPGTEDVLAGKIMKFCTESGFPHLCFRKSQKAKKFLKPGVTD